MTEARPRVALFATCLVDLFRPSVGFAAAALLEAASCRVEVPRGQTCCGQPAYNAGDRETAKALARQAITLLEGYDYVVLPSGSCASMIRCHYPKLFAGEAGWEDRARALAARTFELTSFLVEQGFTGLDASYPGRVAYHDSCSGLRELGVKDQPRALLAQVEGLELSEIAEGEACCGFGGTFCVKYPEISNAMVSAKAARIGETGAETLLGGDLGCLFNLAGKLQRLGMAVTVRHVAEVLAGEVSGPAIGEAAKG